MTLGKVTVDGDQIGTDLDVVEIEVRGVTFTITASDGDALRVAVNRRRLGTRHQTEHSIEIRGMR